jgi:hypothetical protein
LEGEGIERENEIEVEKMEFMGLLIKMEIENKRSYY